MEDMAKRLCGFIEIAEVVDCSIREADALEVMMPTEQQQKRAWGELELHQQRLWRGLHVARQEGQLRALLMDVRKARMEAEDSTDETGMDVLWQQLTRGMASPYVEWDGDRIDDFMVVLKEVLSVSLIGKE